MFVALVPLAVNWSKCDQSGNFLADNYGRNMLDTLDKNSALIIDSENELFIVAYFKIVEGLRPDVEVYDARQNIFFIPAMKTKDKDKKTVTIADFFQFVQQMLTEKKPVFFTNPIFPNFRYADFGVLYKAILGTDNLQNFKIEDPWEKYNRNGLEGFYPGANEKDTIGKYYFSRGKSLAKMNKHELADEFLKKALAVAGDRHSVLKSIAVFYLQTNKYDDAKSLFEKAINVYPFDSDDYATLGMIYHYQSDYEKALEMYAQALAVKGNNVSAIMNRAVLYEQMGDKESIPVIKKGFYQNALNDCELAQSLEPANQTISQLKRRIAPKMVQPE
jgi:tetratricopeptide (TPR) repeat protein